MSSGTPSEPRARLASICLALLPHLAFWSVAGYLSWYVWKAEQTPAKGDWITLGPDFLSTIYFTFLGTYVVGYLISVVVIRLGTGKFGLGISYLIALVAPSIYVVFEKQLGFLRDGLMCGLDALGLK